MKSAMRGFIRQLGDSNASDNAKPGFNGNFYLDGAINPEIELDQLKKRDAERQQSMNTRKSRDDQKRRQSLLARGASAQGRRTTLLTDALDLIESSIVGGGSGRGILGG